MGMPHYPFPGPLHDRIGHRLLPGRIDLGQAPGVQARKKQRPTEASTRVNTAVPIRFFRNDGTPLSSIPMEVYARAREAFVMTGNVKEVAKASGLGWQSAQRLIDVGDPLSHLPSLRDAARVAAIAVSKELAASEKASAKETAHVLASRLEARAKAARKARDHEAKVLGDATKSRADEVRLVRANRMSAMVLAQVNADLLQVSSKLANSLLEDVDKITKRSPMERMTILRTIAGVVHKTAQASQVAVNMERLLMGEPTAILGRSDGSPNPSTDDMTPEEAEQWLALANRAFERRARRSTVVDVPPEEEGHGEVVAELLEDLES